MDLCIARYPSVFDSDGEGVVCLARGTTEVVFSAPSICDCNTRFAGANRDAGCVADSRAAAESDQYRKRISAIRAGCVRRECQFLVHR